MLEKLGSQAKVLQYWNAVAPHLQARFCLSTLGTKIKIERIGNLEYFSKNLATASSRGLDTVKPHGKKIRGSADLVAYLVYDNNRCSDSNEAGGIAYLGTVCAPSYMDHLKVSISEWNKHAANMASVIVKS